MLKVRRDVVVRLALEPVDFRKSIDGLAIAVGHALGVPHQPTPEARPRSSCDSACEGADMPPGRKLRNAEEAREALEAAEREGLSRVAWAHANDVNARSLNAWRLVLGRKPRAALGWVEVVTRPDRQTPPSSGCSLHLGDVVLHVDPGFDDDTLVRVLRAIRRC